MMLPAPSPLNRLVPWAAAGGFLAATATLVGYELARHPEYFQQPSSLAGYMPDLESTWLGLAALIGHWSEDQLRSNLWATWPTWSGMALLAAPFLWWCCPRRPNAPHPSRPTSPGSASAERGVLLVFLSLALFALHVLVAMLVGRQFHGMPPAYHDEYSYIFQAKT